MKKHKIILTILLLIVIGSVGFYIYDRNSYKECYSVSIMFSDYTRIYNISKEYSDYNYKQILIKKKNDEYLLKLVKWNKQIEEYSISVYKPILINYK